MPNTRPPVLIKPEILENHDLLRLYLHIQKAGTLPLETSYSALGRSLKMPLTSVHRRLHRLEALGAIQLAREGNHATIRLLPAKAPQMVWTAQK